MANIIRLGGGYQAGYDDGNTDGYSKGHTDGYNSGHADGYNSGSSSCASKLHFPDGWSLHSTALGETFPGFGSNVIPVCMNQSEWANGYFYWDAVQIGVNDGKSNSINGNTSAAVNYKKNANGSHFADITLAANNLFLPAFFGFDWDKIKSSITSGKITVWLTKD